MSLALVLLLIAIAAAAVAMVCWGLAASHPAPSQTSLIDNFFWAVATAIFCAAGSLITFIINLFSTGATP